LRARHLHTGPREVRVPDEFIGPELVRDQRNRFPRSLGLVPKVGAVLTCEAFDHRTLIEVEDRERISLITTQADVEQSRTSLSQRNVSSLNNPRAASSEVATITGPASGSSLTRELVSI